MGELLLFLTCVFLGYIARRFKKTVIHSINNKSLGDGSIVFFDEDEQMVNVYADENCIVPLMTPIKLDKYGGKPDIYISKFCYAGFITSDGEQLGYGEVHETGEFVQMSNVYLQGSYKMKTRYLWGG